MEAAVDEAVGEDEVVEAAAAVPWVEMPVLPTGVMKKAMTMASRDVVAEVGEIVSEIVMTSASEVVAVEVALAARVAEIETEMVAEIGMVAVTEIVSGIVIAEARVEAFRKKAVDALHGTTGKHQNRQSVTLRRIGTKNWMISKERTTKRPMKTTADEIQILRMMTKEVIVIAAITPLREALKINFLNLTIKITAAANRRTEKHP